MPDAETTIGEAPSEEKLRLHIYMTKEDYEKVKDLAECRLGRHNRGSPRGQLPQLHQLVLPAGGTLPDETTGTLGYQAMEVLYNSDHKITPTEIGAEIGVEGFHVGRQLKDKVQQQLVSKTVEGKTSYYQITESGRQCVEAEHERMESISSDEEKPPAGAPAAGAPAGAPAGKTAVPSQSDLFRQEGELLGIGTKKGTIPLDVIVKWVERTANLDDLNSVWNVLTKMGVSSDVKLYPQYLRKPTCSGVSDSDWVSA